MMLLMMFNKFWTATLFLQDTSSVVQRIWRFITYRFVDSENLKVSLARLAAGILLLILALYLSGRISSFIERRIAKGQHLDPGLRYTIARLFRYLLVTFGVLFVLQQAFDLDLTSLAVIFTALSVGIGFGLQYIAADIASGFILLFERPIRVGDRITIGEDEGDVQSINLRTTVVTTNDRIAIIVPNSKLVGQPVINWSYGDPRARIVSEVGVAYDSDIDHVTRTLIEAAKGVENVLSDPRPRVQFMKFGEYSLDFRLLVWTNLPRRHVQIRSDINYRIFQLFRERDIRIPYPTQEFVLKHGSLPPDFNPALRGDNDGPRMQD